MSVINKDTGAFYKKLKKTLQRIKDYTSFYVWLFIEVCFKDLKALMKKR